MSLDKIFQERYKSLNKEQKKAVDTIEGPVMVVAGPGTGKTTILTLRIANILKQTQTPPNGILAITYTNAGVKAVREKLREVIGNTSHEVYIHTFHSFASAMIAEYPDHFVQFRDIRQISDVEQESIIRTIIAFPEFAPLRPLGRPDTYIFSIIRAISDCKKDAQTPDMVREFALAKIEKIKNDEGSISTRGATKGRLKAEAEEQIEKLQKTIIFADVYERYEKTKEEGKLRDYDDLIIELLVTLRTDNLLLRLIQERFLYVLVDEHQDTNDAQNYIIGLIAEFFDTPNIFIVGDEKQAIYRFQGASVENFLRLRKLWPKMVIINLDTNYRSHQSILDASHKMIENNYDGKEHSDLRKKLKSESEHKKRPLDIVHGENVSAMENYLAEEVKKIIKKEPLATVAIITRRNRELERVLRLFDAHDIPVSSERSIDIFHHPVGVAFFDLIEYFTDPSRVESLAKTLASGLWGLDFGKSVEVMRSIRSNQIDGLEKDIPALREIRERLLEDGGVGGVVEIGELSGLTSIVSRDPSFVAVWRGIVTLAESLSRDLEVTNPLELMKAMILYRQSAESKPVKVAVGAPDLNIKAMTAHGSKGLEFDFVFMPYTTEETWVGRFRGSSFILPEKSSNDSDIRDVRRLFYVAITRAKKHVTILYGDEESDGKIQTPLRFIIELEKGNVSDIKLPRVQSILEIKKDQKKSKEYDVLMTNEAKKVLLQNGLSVTALNHFLECPSKFLYESILKLPQAPSVSSEKGSAMHESLSHVWTGARGETEIQKTIIDSALEYINKSFLSKNDKEVLKIELSQSAPLVAKDLLAHFNPKGKVLSETWVEVPFDSKKEKISIHGKLDVIVDSGDKIEVFDYKTRKGMTAAAAKGETKNDDGNYFRQLVFYHLLLRGDFRYKNKQISTSLVFVSPDEKGRCPILNLEVNEADIKRVKDEIEDLINCVWSGEITNSYCSDMFCQYCGYRRLFR